MTIKSILSRFSPAKKSTWNSLTTDQRARVTKRLMAMAGPRYRIVSGFDQTQREMGITETTGEDGVLDISSRGRLLDMTRNAARNSSTYQTILRQLDYNVCGSKAGKVIISHPDEGLSGDLKGRFAEWTRSADYFDGLSYNVLLKLILKTAIIGGDCVIIYDNRLVDNSGKLLVYEPDEIGSIPKEDLVKHYGKGVYQSMGKVYTSTGRHIGVTVSRSCRGMDVFDPDRCYYLSRNPDTTWLESKWLMPSNIWRIGQGRGISQSACAIGTILDLEDLCGYELQAAKKNSQTFAQITRSASSTGSEVQPPSAFDTVTPIEDMTDEDITKAAKEAAEQGGDQIVSLQAAKSAGIIYEQMPDDYKMELLNTQHPNDKIQDFVQWLAGRAAGSYGLSQAYATLNPDANFRAHQLMTAPAFRDAQKWLENICDWTFYNFCRHLQDNEGVNIPKDIMTYVSWQWPGVDELDETAHQTAVEMRLRNLTGTLRDELGSDWQTSLLQSKAEIDFCRANGLPHPAMQMISGGMRGEFSENAPKITKTV